MESDATTELQTVATPAEVARRIRCHERTVRRLAERGAFRAERLDPSDPKSQWRIFIGPDGLPVRVYPAPPARPDVLSEFAATGTAQPTGPVTRRREIR
jgi:hypothetical protein